MYRTKVILEEVRRISSKVTKCYADERMIEEGGSMTMEAILSRDQRTTSHRVFEEREISQYVRSGARVQEGTSRFRATRKDKKDEKLGKGHLCDPCLVPASCYDDRGIRSRRCGNASSVNATTWLRLGSLLVTLLVVSVHSAPTMTLDDRRLSSPPKWVDPCGTTEDADGDQDVPRIRDEQLLSQIVVQAKTALMHAELFRDDYVKQTFKDDFAEWHSTWKNEHYSWLPGPKEIPKQLGDQLNQEYLNKLEFDTALLDAYEYMQKYAVGLEQIVWDQKDHRLEFSKKFEETEYKLRTVLCELYVALAERGVPLRPDVTRDAMSSEYRSEMSSSSTFRNLRDWLIFRDYMNGLEYVVQVFEHIRRGLQS